MPAQTFLPSPKPGRWRSGLNRNLWLPAGTSHCGSCNYTPLVRLWPLTFFIYLGFVFLLLYPKSSTLGLFTSHTWPIYFLTQPKLTKTHLNQLQGGRLPRLGCRSGVEAQPSVAPVLIF